MEYGKLIELLNEYERSKGTNLEITNWKCVYGNLSYFGYGNGYSEFLCISKRYGFIQWLVDNDKIDLEKYKDKSELYTLKVVHGTDYYIDLLTNKVNSDFLLMLLSISDTPIEDLISYLK